MHTKLFALLLASGLAGTGIVNAQSPTESPSPATKHRVSKKAAATASLAQEVVSPSTAESPSASPKAKRARREKKTTAETSPSPAATTEASPSPAAKHARKAKATAAASPAMTPGPSPAKKTLADFFKPKTSQSPSSSAAPATTAATAKAETEATPATGGGHGLVWVNTTTHVYHKEGSRFYGTTKKGKYVSEADAIKEGDRAAAKGQ
jgi:hypothetical protein